MQHRFPHHRTYTTHRAQIAHYHDFIYHGHYLTACFNINGLVSFNITPRGSETQVASTDWYASAQEAAQAARHLIEGGLPAAEQVPF